MPTGILSTNLGDTVSFRTVSQTYSGKVVRIILALSEPTLEDLQNFYKITPSHIAYQDVIQPISCDRIVIAVADRFIILFRDPNLNPDIIGFNIESHDFSAY